ncbi:phytase [Metarhizium album ARSEF 1941]|uniref:Phytase A n=1 Tax=Metarhizium album (strain ARSEF 1941) TaxID=1081103 RepID=A0A0B2WYG2_METAS|nr:phytase [Metarhizium album ARSEF 1941]KHN97890.1 phytase [Metarhizium album ARSEF 1941]
MGLISDTVTSLRALARPSYKYRAIPAPVTSVTRRNPAYQVFHDELPPRSRYFRLSMGIMLLAVFVFLGFAIARDRSDSKSCVNNGSCSHDFRKHWGQYSPYFSADPGPIKPDVPSGCDLTFASILSRHGSRNPTAGKSQAYKDLIERIQKDVKRYGKGFGFLKKYKYALGFDDLTALGEQEMVKSGNKFFERYQKLAEHAAHPFVRASGSDRVIKSAQNFVHGFYEAKAENGSKYLKDILVLPEGNDSNNTLDHGTCGAFENGPDAELAHDKQARWRNIWATPIMDRLNTKLPGADITLEETIYLMDLCPFNTVASKKSTPSDFCRLFSKEEWLGYEYYESLDKWYGYGPGNPLGPTQGVGYVNELIARLSNSPVRDHTSTNETLDSSPSTFPLNRPLYADFSHDNTLMTVYGALGLYTNATEMPTDHRVSPEKADGFSASQAVPFGARMYVEKMRCDQDDHEMVRILVNDRVTPPKGCKADKLGRCEVGDFLKGLDFAKKGGLWDQC